MTETVEQALRDALAFAESIIDTVRDPLLVLDGSLCVIRASREFYRAFGVTPGETEGRLVYELGNRQWDIPCLRHLLEEVLPHNTTFRDFEVEHTFERIGRRIMLLNARKLYREQSNSELILLAIEDVTERRDAEEARREAETRFTEMVKNVRDHSIFLTDPDGVITSWNVTAERVLGYSESEVVGRHFSLIFTPEDLQNGLPEWELRQAREQGRAEDERWHLRKGGERFWALGIVTPLRDAAGKLTGYSKILRDITERKRMEDELRESEGRFRNAYQIETVGVIFFDLAGRITEANDAFLAMGDYDREDVAAGRLRWDSLTPPEWLPASQRAIAELQTTGRTTPYEKEYLRKDGSRWWALFAARRIGPAEAVEYVLDISDRKRAEAALRQARDELELRVEERTAELRQSQQRALQAERLAAIGQTVTALAHEGRNALQRAAACLSRLEMRQEGRPEELALTGRARQALGDLERLFDDVRAYAAPIRVEHKACDLRQVWREAWAQVVARHARRDARLEEEGGTSLTCEADPFRLRQVFTNLLANALEACPDPVVVRVGCSEAGLSGRPAVRVSVRDNGPGFPAEQRQHLFEPFRTTKPTGTGLGMAITKRIIEAHGGEVAVGAGPGAQVIITLPRRRAQDEPV